MKKFMVFVLLAVVIFIGIKIKKTPVDMKEQARKIIEKMDKRLERDSSDVEAYLVRGEAKEELEDYYGAIDDYSAVITINPKSEEAYARRSMAKADNKDYYGAMDDYERAKNINPEFYLVPYSYARMMHNSGVENPQYIMAYLKEAKKYYEKTIQLNPDFDEVYVNLASANFDLEEFQEALKNANLAIEKGYKNFMPYYIKGLVFLKTGKYQEGIDNLTKVIEINPTYATAYLIRGNYIYAYKKDINRAFDDYNKAIEYDSTLVDAYTGRAMLYAGKEDFENALNDCKKATEVGTITHAHPYETCGSIKFQLKDYEGAISDYENVLRLSNDYTQINRVSSNLRVLKTLVK